MIYGEPRNLNAVIIGSVTEASKHIDGIGIKETQINDDGHLLITYTDNRVEDAGEVVRTEAVAPIVNAWLDDHPEATTTVEDGSITEAKIAPLFLPEIKTTIDSTLSQSGAAAEAEAVGAEISRIDTALDKTVHTDEQTLTAEQQAQALANLGLSKNCAAGTNGTIDLTQIANIAKCTKQYNSVKANVPNFVQGMTVDSNLLYLSYYCPESENEILIEVYDLTTKELVNSNKISSGYHGNSLCVIGEKLYTSTVRNSVLEIDKSSLEVINTYNLSTNVGFVTKYNGRLVVGSYSGGIRKCYYLNTSNSTLTQIFDFTSSTSGYLLQQGASVYNDKLYAVSSNPKGIVCLSMADGSLLGFYQIGDYANVNPTGEIEDVEIIGGIAYVASCTYMSYDNYRTARVFTFSLDISKGEKVAYDGGNVNGVEQLYVGDNSKCNPDGTSSNPFPTLSQALQFVHSPIAGAYGTVRININKDCDEILYLRDKNVRIFGNSHKLIRAYIMACDVMLSTVEFTGESGENIQTIYATQGSLIASNITIDACTHTNAIQLSEITASMFSITNSSGKAINVYRSAVVCDVAFKDAASFDLASIRSFSPQSGTTSNAAGAWRWQKFSNGFVECSLYKVTSITATNQQGEMYYTDELKWDLPFKLSTISNVSGCIGQLGHICNPDITAINASSPKIGFRLAFPAPKSAANMDVLVTISGMMS